MFDLLFKKTSTDKKIDNKLSKVILGFLGSEEISCTLPEVAPQWKTELETNYAELKAIADERILIYKNIVKPSSIFASPDNFSYIRLNGGYSNTSYKLSKKDGEVYISRIAGIGTESFIDRFAEWHNATQAAELGLNPRIIYSDKKGQQLSLYLSSPQPMTPEQLRLHPEYLSKIAIQLRTLHNSTKKFHNDVNIFERNKGLYALIEKSKLVLPEEYQPIKEHVEQIAQIFKQLTIQQVPCHNDAYYNNFLLSEGIIWLIDWEYSGNHDAMWDLAYFSSLAGLDEQQKNDLLSSYFNSSDFKSTHYIEYLRFIVYGLVVKDFLILWAFVQLANKNTSVSEAEFKKWSDDALIDSILIMSSEEFNNALHQLEEISQKSELSSFI